MCDILLRAEEVEGDGEFERHPASKRGGRESSARIESLAYFALLEFAATFAFLLTSIQFWDLHRRERLTSNLVAESVDHES